ncbi:tannase/feruloyl esterase family alpha/beta hydrolase [Novosphingobium sp. Gsoil 351]|uniref:tannase/feruloyl esterase family alpha/beta hydrolase n=1 Tax=Novosphingobium sp. Gsoil 351 TaxID=2675225 RepID=UPI0012B494C4|nr:tannase/feruloyl esterase family alpha/beta hydrolase [Novosphingobium sp. Gsoil 351]QGN55848.1 tannase/feruloyl esterase family alpha/beta hydrolase [Novosphingobium sp. Gsoil 351]
MGCGRRRARADRATGSGRRARTARSDRSWQRNAPRRSCRGLRCAQGHRFLADQGRAIADRQCRCQARHCRTSPHCLVNGRIAPTIGYRMWLPLGTWNGKFAQTGCGGRCGDILDDGCQIVLARGYACLAADLGHKGTFYDDLWAIDNVPGEIDFGFRATHVSNITGRAVTEAFYGAKPRYAYYFGASTGGRQGLIEAQRFPADFDGIVAGEPAMGTPGTPSPETGPALRDSVAALNPGGKPIVTPDEVMAIHAAALARCDLDDNARDGFISNPRACAFKPVDMACKAAKQPTCLTPEQVAAVTRVYANGAMSGSEKGWLGAYVGATEGEPGRYLWRLKNPYKYPYAWIFNDATNPDLRAFKARGGKLILYQGWADEATYPGNPPAYYETVERLMGGRAATQDFFRLFMIPGQNHIPQVGGGAETVDYLSYLEAWVERGEVPEVLLAGKYRELARFAGPVTYASYLRPDNVEFSRPVYPYPVQARYSGKGDVRQAGNWKPFAPR